MKSLDVNSNMKNLMNVAFRGDAKIDFASIGIMKVKKIIKLGSVQRTIGLVIFVNLKVK